MSDLRRQRIIGIITSAPQPVTGTELAAQLQVSRQIIVQDMAILRAAGGDIISTPRGYLRGSQPANRARYTGTLAVRHTRAQIAQELNALVDVGLRVVDVIIDHPIYGELRGMLMLESRSDVRSFLSRLEGTEPLSTLTRGIHLHTVEASRSGALDEGREALREFGILLEAENTMETGSIDKTADDTLG